MKRFCFTMVMAVVVMSAFSQGPNNTAKYYQSADGKKGEALKTAMHEILRGQYKGKTFKVKGYTELASVAYPTTDMRSDRTIWDMYSTIPISITKTSGDNSVEGGMFNKEHSVPQSWFGEASPMKSDLFHVYPTDAWVNNMRSNYPYGVVKSVANPAKDASADRFSIRGKCATPGYSGTVFEPNDQYKGDFARTYFYMATCYEDKSFTSSLGSEVFESGDKKTYPMLKEWALNMFLEWSHNDAVSEKETKRNDAVAELQYNRNPFIDYPGLEEYIWGSMRDVAFSYDNYVIPEGTSPYVPGPNTNPDNPVNPDGPGNVTPTPAEGECVYKRVTSTSDLVAGAGYIIVCESENMAMSENSNNIRKNVSLTTSGGSVTTSVNTSGKPYEVTLGYVNGKYTFYDETEKVYLAQTKKENKLHTATETSSENAQWTISFSGNDAIIKNVSYTGYSIQYNKSAPRFCCYSSTQQPVQLYKRQSSTTAVGTVPLSKAKPNTVIYDMQGRRVGTTANGMPRLKKGVYVIGNRKVVVK